MSLTDRHLLFDGNFWLMDEIYNEVSLHLGVFNWTLLNCGVQQLNSLLFVSISFLEPSNKFFLLLFQLFGGLANLLGSVVRIIDTLVVKGTVFVHHGAIHFFHGKFGEILTILHRLIRLLQGPVVRIFLLKNHIVNFFLLILDPIELASVSIVDTENVFLDVVVGGRPLSVKEVAVLILFKFLRFAQLFKLIHLVILKVVHVLHELVPSLHVIDSFIGLLLLLL